MKAAGALDASLVNYQLTPLKGTKLDGYILLLEYRDRNAQVLPGGARKLLDIALTMVARPRILLLDEPTSGVSAQEKFDIMQMVLDAVRAEGTTVLFVEHDMEVVSRFAQRVLAFYDGRIIVDAPPQQALADPEVQKYVAGKRA